MKYIVVIGNLAHIVGPFDTRREAEAYADSIMYSSGRWAGYSVNVAAIYPPSINVA